MMLKVVVNTKSRTKFAILHWELLFFVFSGCLLTVLEDPFMKLAVLYGTMAIGYFLVYDFAVDVLGKTAKL